VSRLILICNLDITNGVRGILSLWGYVNSFVVVGLFCMADVCNSYSSF